MAKVIELYKDKAGEYRWRKIRGKKITSVMGEGDPDKSKVIKAAEAEAENGEFAIKDLTMEMPGVQPEPVENPGVEAAPGDLRPADGPGGSIV